MRVGVIDEVDVGRVLRQAARAVEAPAARPLPLRAAEHPTLQLDQLVVAGVARAAQDVGAVRRPDTFFLAGE